MIAKNWKEYIAEVKQGYYKIGYITCDALFGEKIIFNKYGFDHLIWKGKKIRSIDEQAKRLRLFQEVPSILREAKQFKDYRVVTRISNKTRSLSTARFWSFTDKNKKIVVIIRQTNNGSKHFFSVMCSGA